MNNEASMIGQIIDMPMEDFESELKRQEVNIGTINNLILNLEAQYNELRQRKDAVLNLVFEGHLDKDNPQIDGISLNDVLSSLYAEMTKVEQKIVFLKNRVKELIDVGIWPI